MALFHFHVTQDGPSASIQNQRELLCRYCEEQGWRVAGIFQGDGFTGLNMDRPDFQKMLAAVERGMFDVILTKDLSLWFLEGRSGA